MMYASPLKDSAGGLISSKKMTIQHHHSHRLLKTFNASEYQQHNNTNVQRKKSQQQANRQSRQQFENPPVCDDNDDEIIENFIESTENDTGIQTMERSRSLMELMAENSILRQGDLHIEIQDAQLTTDPQQMNQIRMLRKEQQMNAGNKNKSSFSQSKLLGTYGGVNQSVSNLSQEPPGVALHEQQEYQQQMQKRMEKQMNIDLTEPMVEEYQEETKQA